MARTAQSTESGRWSTDAMQARPPICARLGFTRCKAPLNFARFPELFLGLLQERGDFLARALHYPTTR